MDLITALGRLLHDGTLRDEFAAQPQAVVERLQVRASDHAALLAISAADLEFQAGILLGKRFELIKNLVPRTLAALGEKARSDFFAYARTRWPRGVNQAWEDAVEFCRHCERQPSSWVCHAELNRLNFVLSKKCVAVHFVRGLSLRKRDRNAIQMFIRLKNGNWRESVFYLGW